MTTNSWTWRDGFKPCATPACRGDRRRPRAGLRSGVVYRLLGNATHVNRTTIITHLDRRGTERLRSVRKMTDRSVRRAAGQYASGESLRVVATRFGVDARTLARDFRHAGVAIRPRRGWPPSD